MSDARFEHLREFGRPMCAPRYSVILDAGEPSEGAYLVTSGRVRLSLPDGDGTPLWSRVLGEGTILGLPSAIAGELQSLKAEAIEPTELTFLESHKLTKLVKDNPEFASEILEALSVEVRELHRKWSRLAEKNLRRRRKSNPDFKP